MGGGGSKTAPEGENEEDELPKETEADKKDPNNKPLDVGKDFGGPCKKRKCTDLLCTLLLAFAWFCMTVVGFACIPGNDLDQATGLKKGNPYKLINGIDYKDRVCGIDSDVRSRRPAVLRRLHAIDATRVHQTRSWLVSFSSLRPFGPFPVNTMLRAGPGRRRPEDVEYLELRAAGHLRRWFIFHNALNCWRHREWYGYCG